MTEPPTIRITTASYAELSRTDLDGWADLSRRVHPPDEARLGSDLAWAPLDPLHHLIRLWVDGELRACSWVTRRMIEVDGRGARIAGVRGVMTDPACRRHGYGRLIMARTHELAASFEDCEFALLFSSVMAVPFYRALGWRIMPGPILCDQPDGKIDYTQRLPTAPVMVRQQVPSDPLPRPPIDVRGLPW